MTTLEHENIETVRSLYAAFGRGDVPYILSRIAPDATWGIESIAQGEVPAYGILAGKDVGKFAAAWAETGEFRSFDASEFVAAGDHVFNVLRYELHVKATGRVVKNESMQHWTLRNGKVVRWRGYEDTAATRDAYRR